MTSCKGKTGSESSRNAVKKPVATNKETYSYSFFLSLNLSRILIFFPQTYNSVAEAVSFPHNSLGRGGGEDEGGGGSCPGTPEMRRRQEEVVRRLAAQVGAPDV